MIAAQRPFLALNYSQKKTFPFSTVLKDYLYILDNQIKKEQITKSFLWTAIRLLSQHC